MCDAAAQIVGTLLVLSLAITPAAAAQRWSPHPLVVTGLSIGFALVACVGGILAGQVLDSYNRRPPATFIQVVSSQEPRGGAPIEVAADSMGYFTIQGLKPGQGYELIARAKDGDRILAGRVWVTPPDPKVLIRVSEDLATGTTQALAPDTSVLGPAGWSPDGKFLAFVGENFRGKLQGINLWSCSAAGGPETPFASATVFIPALPDPSHRRTERSPFGPVLRARRYLRTVAFGEVGLGRLRR